MTGFQAAPQRKKLCRCSKILAACARSEKNEFTEWADFVEKLFLDCESHR
jgi:hypothetical protein